MAETWYLRTDGTTYGPKTREELAAWAKIGRVMPGQDVSADCEIWHPVEDVPFLNMRWSIDIGDGNPRGPFHKDAAEMLLRSGRIPAGSKLVESRAPFTEEEIAAFEESRTAAGKNAEPVQAEMFAETAAAQAEEPGEIAAPEETAAPEVEAATPARPERPAAAAVENELIDKLEALHAELVEKEKTIAELRAKVLEAGDERKRASAAAAGKLKDALAAAAAEKDAALAAEASRAAARIEAAEAEKKAAAEEWQRRFDALAAEKEAEAAERAAAEKEAERKLAEAEKRAADRERAVREEMRVSIDEASARAAAAEARAEAAAAELNEVLQSSNVREAELRKEAQDLREKLNRVPPDADSAATVSSAVYKLMRDEADELAKMLETETREAEAARSAWNRRADRLLARRQELLRRIGAGVEDMTRIATRERPDDPQIARLRQERDSLRALNLRAAQESETRIRGLSEKLRALELEAERLRKRAAEADSGARQLAELREKLSLREKALLEERQRAAEESRRRAEERQALLARVEMFESQSSGRAAGRGTQPSGQDLELPSWMGFKS